MRKPKPNHETEWWIKQQVRKIFETTDWKFWMPAAGMYGLNGISDFLAVKQPALFMAIETKYDDVVTAQQFKFLTDVHQAGHYAFLVDETNIGELQKLLSNLSNHPVDHFMKWQDQNPVMDMRISKD
jgi:hypothetical protein